MSLEATANASQLAKASGLALVSMVIIIVTVVTQGFRVPAELRGELKGGILIHSGIFEAIGVISFGKPQSHAILVMCILTYPSFCLP